MHSTETSQNSSLEPGLAAAGGGGEVSGMPSGRPMRAPWWVQAVPFFLSAFFFLSALFALFAPLPLLFLRFRSGRRWMWGALATNSAIVGLAGGGLSLAIYAVFAGTLAVVMSELIHRKRSLERVAAITMLAMALVGALVVAWQSHIHGVNPLVALRTETAQMVDQVVAQVSESNPVNPADVEEWKQNVLIEFPSAVAVFALVLVWANLGLLLRVNPSGVREHMGLDGAFLKKWKAPEFLVWPTIVAGLFLIVEVQNVSAVALNVFRFLMAIYAIQGLSILSFFFDTWNVRGFFRTLSFLIALFLMMPLLLSLGFFDLWFDFRSKFRQS